MITFLYGWEYEIFQNFLEIEMIRNTFQGTTYCKGWQGLYFVVVPQQHYWKCRNANENLRYMKAIQISEYQI